MKVKQNRQAGLAGVLLIECLVVMSITLALAAQGGVSMIRAAAARNFTNAKQRLRIVSQSIAVEQICLQTTGCAVSPALMANIPMPGSVLSEGYIFTLANSGGGAWTYAAIPVGNLGSGSVFVGSDGVLRCEFSGSAQQAGPNSRPCN